MKTHLEIEAKYDVADGQQLPDLVGVGGVDESVALPEMVLTATYFDTAGHALAAAGATLRRRSGGTDDGWHLKLRLADGERLEVHRRLGRGQMPPAALTALVRGFVGSQRLEAVATLVNRRTVHNLRAGDGRLLAELADDSVSGQRHDVEADPLTWRELEIELVDGDRAVLAALDAAVQGSGVVPATSESKAARVLGTPPARPPAATGPRRSSQVGDVLEPSLRQAALDLQAADPQVRLDRPEAPTRMRTAVRRLRAALALQRQVAPDQVPASIRSELAWLDTVVAGLEELDTTRAQIRAALSVEPKELVLGPVGRRVDRELAAARRTSLASVREVLDSQRYLDLLDGVVALPTATDAAVRAADVLPDLADRALSRAERRLAQLRRAQSADDRRWQLRGAARAVDRARYAQQLAARWTGPMHDRLVATLEEMSTVLTRLEVSLQTQDALRGLAVQAQSATESDFTLGRLHGLEQMHATELQRRLNALRKQARRLRKSLSG